MRVTETSFGELHGEKVKRFTLENDNGMKVSTINYGCVITEIVVPDKDGNFENVVLGFDNINDYVDYSPYFGAIVGRVAGRLKDAEFELNGKHYLLPKNEGNNHLHGNSEFSTALWNGFIVESPNDKSENDKCGVKFTYESKDLANGYPGNLRVSVTYELSNANELSIIFGGLSDKDTVLNMTNHSYFNLSGNAKKNVCNHDLKSNIKSYVELGEDLIPTGNLINVTGTSFDFSHEHALLAGMKSEDKQNIIAGHGYDHALVFELRKGNNLATLFDPQSGRKMIMTTDYPCFVLYSGNQLTEIQGGKYMGICMEAQLLPDAPHNKDFGSIILEAGKPYSHCTSYRFMV